MNTKKYLDFSDFKRAFEFYTKFKEKTPEIIEKISYIKKGMNKSRTFPGGDGSPLVGRTCFNMPAEHKYRITPGWLLGFVEGDGSFFIRRKNYQLNFAIVQHSRDLELMYKICDFLYELPRFDLERMEKTSIMIKESQALILSESSVVTNKDSLKNSFTNLVIVNNDIIKSVIIPFFSSMTWHSKKKNS